MMYSQQEFDMMRRQTLQIEAEKRAMMRTLLMIVAVALMIALILLGFVYRRYSQSAGLISTAETRAATADAQLQDCSKELQEKRAILESQARNLEKANEQVASLIPRVMSKVASDAEIALLAHRIHESPGRSIALPGIPPDKILKRYRYRSGGLLHAYVLVAGNVDGRWILYSNLVGKSRGE